MTCALGLVLDTSMVLRFRVRAARDWPFRRWCAGQPGEREAERSGKTGTCKCPGLGRLKCRLVWRAQPKKVFQKDFLNYFKILPVGAVTMWCVAKLLCTEQCWSCLVAVKSWFTFHHHRSYCLSACCQNQSWRCPTLQHIINLKALGS